MATRMFVCFQFFLFLTFVTINHAKKVRIDNYQNSVYVKMGANPSIQLEPMNVDSIFVDRNDYELISVTANKEFTIGGAKKTGHLVQFMKYGEPQYPPFTVLAIFFTDESYYKVIKRTLMQV